METTKSKSDLPIPCGASFLRKKDDRRRGRSSFPRGLHLQIQARRRRSFNGGECISTNLANRGLRSAARNYKATRQRTRPGRTTKSSA